MSIQLTKEQVLAVVTEASAKMGVDANYTSMMVGDFVQAQQPVSHFIQAHEQELGGAEGIVSVIFHCALVLTAFERAKKRPRTLSYEDLDTAASGNPLARLAKAQLPLHEFILANVENASAQNLIAIVALAIDGAV